MIRSFHSKKNYFYKNILRTTFDVRQAHQESPGILQLIDQLEVAAGKLLAE
jgi:hypothetical protein